MPLPPLYLDEDVSVVVAAILQARGFGVVTARDSGQLGRSDREQLAYATAAGRVLLTHNRVDFEHLHKESLKAGKSHSGIIIARRRPLMELTARVGQLLIRLPAEALKNQLFYV
jgi:predicted nuclease of predicted toxin-antitoxin system